VQDKEQGMPGDPALGIRWGFSGRAHYGFIQQRIHDLVAYSSHLRVNKVLWTAHEGGGQDEMTKKVINGPDIIGKAMTGQCGAWFGAMLHLFAIPVSEEVTVPGTTRKVTLSRSDVFMFLRDHTDPDDPYKVPYIAKPRGPYQLCHEWPTIMEPDLAKFYTMLDDMMEKARKLVVPVTRPEPTVQTVGGTVPASTIKRETVLANPAPKSSVHTSTAAPAQPKE
jgi:hypothetical protein